MAPADRDSSGNVASGSTGGAPSHDGSALIVGAAPCDAMTLYETAFRLQHDCPLNDLSRRHPELVMTSWCNSETDVLEISEYEGAGQFQDDLEAMWRSMKVKPLRRSQSGRDLQVMIYHCGCDNIPAPVTAVFEKNRCLELQPCVYRGGWEYYRIISFSEKDARNVFATLGRYCNIEVVSRRSIRSGAVREAMLVSTTALFGGLTRKQAQALVFALENGYYQVPKKVTTEEMASRLRLPRTTYEEHLRKAEGKVLRSVAPYITMSPSR